jgi:integrase
MTKENAAGFVSDWCRKLLVEFSEELITRYGGYDTKEKLPYYVPFFARIDQEFGSQDEITVAKLCRLYPNFGLKKYDVIYHFLGRKEVIPVGRNDRDNEYQYLKQQAIVSAAQNEWYGSTLKDFLEHMLKVRERFQKRGWKNKHERFKMLSITKLLTYAKQFLQTSGVHDTRQLTPEHLDAYFFNKKGHLTALDGFVRFLRKRGRTFLKLDMSGRPRNETFQSMPDKVFDELMLKLLNPGDNNVKESLVLLFMLVYSQRPKTLATLRLEDIFFNKDGFRIFFARDEVHIDPAVGDILGRYLEARNRHRDEGNEYLFPGMLPGSHIGVATLKDYPGKFGVTGKELFVTSLVRLSKFKLRHPSVLSKSLGVSVYTVVKHLSIFNERIQQEARKTF